MADHREDYNLLGHEQVHPDYIVSDNIVEVLDHDLLLETILPPVVTRLTNILQPYCNRASTRWTNGLARSAQNRINKRDSRTHQNGLVCAQANS